MQQIPSEKAFNSLSNMMCWLVATIISFASLLAFQSSPYVATLLSLVFMGSGIATFCSCVDFYSVDLNDYVSEVSTKNSSDSSFDEESYTLRAELGHGSELAISTATASLIRYSTPTNYQSTHARGINTCDTSDTNNKVDRCLPLGVRN